MIPSFSALPVFLVGKGAPRVITLLQLHVHYFSLLEGNNHFMQSDKNLDSSSSPVSHLRLFMTQRRRPLLPPLLQSYTETLLPQ